MKLDSLFKIKFLLSVIAISSGIYSNMSMGATPDGKISFSGSVHNVTCIVEGGNSEGGSITEKDFTVNMRSARVADFNQVNDRAGTTPFFIRLKGEYCVAGDGYAIQFEKGSNSEFIDADTGYLKNIVSEGPGGAKGIQLIITDESGNDFDFKKSVNMSPKKNKESDKDTQFDFTVDYISVDRNVAPGKVEGNLLYSVVYP